MSRPLVLIATVGRQPMPVLLAALEYRPAAVQLIATREVRDVAYAVRDALKGHPSITRGVFVHEPVLAYERDAAYERCEKARNYSGYRDHDFLLNISGGTTMMALGAQRAARDFDWPMCYVDSDHGMIISLDSRGAPGAPLPIAARTLVATYLAAHGAECSPKQTWGALTARDDPALGPYLETARLLGQAGPHSAPLLDALRRPRVKDQPRVFCFQPQNDPQRQLAAALVKRGLIAPDDDVPDKWAVIAAGLDLELLDGHWLELYVWDACRRLGTFDDVRCSVEIRRQVELGPGQSNTVYNELDVVVTSRGRMAVISCKTGPELSRTQDKTGRLALYELSALLQTDLMGLYARKVLVTNQEKIDLEILKRARMSQTICIPGSRLQDVVKAIADLLDMPVGAR